MKKPCEDCSRDWGHSYCGVCKGTGYIEVPDAENESIMNVRDIIAKLDAGELHQVAVGLAEYMEEQDIDESGRYLVFRDADQNRFEQVSMMICEALSRFASCGLKVQK